MSQLGTSARVAVALGGVSLLSILLSHLALVDIAHGEGNLEGEWMAVQVSAVLIVAFHAVALWTLVRLIRNVPGS